MKVLLTLVILFPVILLGQTKTIDTSIRPKHSSTKIESVPEIDGEVMNDPVWMAVDPITELVQIQPNLGNEASEKTEIRIAYDAQTFYLAVVCYDANPEQLVVTDSRRDASLDEADAFLFILDTYHDKQNGFVFGTNPIGIEYDAQVDNEGQGNFNSNRQQGGVIGGFNLNWDASWEVKTSVGEYGWSAEFAIPLRTIRYKSGEDVTWGANFRRNIRKTNEIAYWAPMPIQFDMKRLSLAGELSGLSLKSPGNLKVIPYALGNVERVKAGEATETDADGEVGVDLKYSVTPSLTLDLTYNTDFAQVEVDEVQVNLDRFNLFFPEKRPFFLENAGLFSVGSPGEVDLFFSRKIGISDEGSIVPIIGGARLSGKQNNTNVAILSMFTDEVPEQDIVANNFTVARLNQQLGRRTTVGGGFISRYGMGLDSANSNSVLVTDTKIGLGNKAQITGYLAKSETPELDGKDVSFQLKTQYEWNGLNAILGYTEVQENFNPEVGFLLRGAFRKPEFLVLKQVRPKGDWLGGILELRPHVSYRGYWDFEGNQVTGFLHVDNHWEWKGGFEVHTGVNFTQEGVLNAFEISENVFVPVGEYNNQEAQIIIITNPSKPFSISTRHVIGGFFDGNRASNSLTLAARTGDKFNSSFSYLRNDVNLEGGSFSTKIFKGRLTYSFTPRISLTSLVQYNSVADVWSMNLRFNVLQQSNTGLFVVYNVFDDSFGNTNSTFTVKYTRLFDLIK
jgi:hypothetical protein